MADKQVFVNTPMDSETLEKLDVMVGENESSRAQYIRLLIKRQWEERERNEAQKKSFYPTSVKSKSKRNDRVTA